MEQQKKYSKNAIIAVILLAFVPFVCSKINSFSERTKEASGIPTIKEDSASYSNVASKQEDTIQQYTGRIFTKLMEQKLHHKPVMLIDPLHFFTNDNHFYVQKWSIGYTDNSGVMHKYIGTAEIQYIAGDPSELKNWDIVLCQTQKIPSE